MLRFGPPESIGPEATRRFERLAKTVAALHHTNIVPIFGVGCEDGVHYQAMQLVDGESLAEVVRDAFAGGAPPAGHALGADARDSPTP